MKRTTELFGYAIESEPVCAAACRAWSMIKSGRRGHYMACANPHSLVEARSDPAFAVALREADMLLPDGSGILLAARLLGKPVAERVAGFEFFRALSEKAEREGGLSYFFLGSSPAVLGKIAARLARDYPSIRLAGMLSPPFRASFSIEEEDAMITAVNRSGADVLWVGMTAPKQEKWIHRHRDRLDVPFAGAVGAVFDFYAGSKKRAPEWVCRAGLEWLPRLVREPRRLWRRNFVSTPVFLSMVLQERLRLAAPPRERL